MTAYRPCCPQRTYADPAISLGDLSPSAFHSGTRTYAHHITGYNIDTGDEAYDLRFVTSPSEESSPNNFDPVARDHAGQHYFLISRSQESADPRQDATIFDLPDVIGGHDTGVYTFELVSLPADGWSEMVSSTELVHDEGIVTSSLDIGDSYRTWNSFEVSGLDWSPFEDCLYAVLVHRDSGHELASIYENLANDGYDPPPSAVEFWRIQFDGSYEVLWSLDAAGSSNFSGPITVAADGAVWFASNVDSYQIWRYMDGTVSEVVPEDGPYAYYGSSFGATPWGDILVPTGTFFAPGAGMIMLSADGSVIDYDCPELSGSNYTIGMMRQEDFTKLYVVTAPWNSVFETMREIDFKRCGSGWRVGGM